MAWHTNYWSSSRLAEWIRGTDKPKADTAEGWDAWYKMAKSAHPWRYWIAEEGLDLIQDFVTWPTRKLYDAKYYCNNRFITRTHQLTAHARDITPGHWCDVGDRFLPCLFNELVEYIEVELAWWQIAWANPEERDKYQTPWWAHGWWRVRGWRCPQAGLDNLAWQMTCDNRDFTAEDDPNYGALTSQAHNAAEILALYNWWTKDRPGRPDIYEASGWSDYCEQRRLTGRGFLNFDGQDRQDTTAMHELMNDMETKYEEEDEAMLIRLIRIRKALWT